MIVRSGLNAINSISKTVNVRNFSQIVMSAGSKALPRKYVKPGKSVQCMSLSTVKIVFLEGMGTEPIEIDAEEGRSVLDVAVDNDIDLEGACGGELACSTCHVILSQELYDFLPEKDEEEEDMLELAVGLTDTSRLCCQIKVTPELEGAVFTIPDEMLQF
jgi:ferredoxin